MQTVYACGGGSRGSQQREVADGADVVFTDTDELILVVVVVSLCTNFQLSKTSIQNKTFAMLITLVI